MLHIPWLLLSTDSDESWSLKSVPKFFTFLTWAIAQYYGSDWVIFFSLTPRFSRLWRVIVMEIYLIWLPARNIAAPLREYTWIYSTMTSGMLKWKDTQSTTSLRAKSIRTVSAKSRGYCALPGRNKNKKRVPTSASPQRPRVQRSLCQSCVPLHSTCLYWTCLTNLYVFFFFICSGWFLQLTWRQGYTP